VPDPTRVPQIEKALQDASTQVSVTWVSFIGVSVYIMVAVGSLTHVDLLMERPIALPIISTEVPLVGFFALAPILYLSSYLYLLLRVKYLIDKFDIYEFELLDLRGTQKEKLFALGKLDIFVLMQALVGRADERNGIFGLFQRFVIYSTTVLAPVAILLFVQLQFLPYHSETVTWLHRICVACSAVISLFLLEAIFLSRAKRGRALLRLANWNMYRASHASVTSLVIIFSICIFCYPVESIYRNSVSSILGYISAPFTSQDSPSLTDAIFRGSNGLNRQPWFSNTLQLRLFDLSTYNKKASNPRVSFHGRDFSGADFFNAKLNGIDMTGANLVNADFLGADISGGIFDCFSESDPLAQRSDPESVGDCTDLSGADFTLTAGNGSSFKKAILRNVTFYGSYFDGADFSGADLRGSQFPIYASFIGSSFQDAKLQFAAITGADFRLANLDGADFSWGHLSGNDFSFSRLTNLKAFATDFSDQVPPFDAATKLKLLKVACDENINPDCSNGYLFPGPVSLSPIRVDLLLWYDKSLFSALAQSIIPEDQQEIFDAKVADILCNVRSLKDLPQAVPETSDELAALTLSLACDPQATKYRSLGTAQHREAIDFGANFKTVVEILHDEKLCASAASLSDLRPDSAWATGLSSELTGHETLEQVTKRLKERTH
jgi:uncharacterized protein YjbI with pentapeptide repeats